MALYVNERVDELDLARALGEVSSERRAYALGFRNENDRRLSVAVYLLLKEALTTEYGLDDSPRLVRGEFGKPSLVDHPDIHFSWSHSGHVAVCAVSDHPVGVDVEAVAPVDDEVARRVLSAAEYAQMRTSPEPEIAFARLWTRKEALLKLRGVCFDEAMLPELLHTTQDVSFEVRTLLNGAYALTYAYESTTFALPRMRTNFPPCASCRWLNTRTVLQLPKEMRRPCK